MRRFLLTNQTLILIGLGLSACAASVVDVNDARSRGISDDITASRWNGATSPNHGKTLDMRDEPNGSIGSCVDPLRFSDRLSVFAWFGPISLISARR